MSEFSIGPWQATTTPAGKGKVVDKNGFSVANATATPWTQGLADARLIAAAPELLEACQTFAEWLRREDAVGGLEQPWRGKRDTPEGEALWQEWFNENLRLCALAQEQGAAAVRKATGAAE